MFKNYLKVAFRNIRKQKVYAFINIAGWAVGMTVCILIALWVRQELSFDRFHANADRIHRLTLDAFLGAPQSAPVAPTPAAYVLMNLWLRGFAYRAPLSAWAFLLAALMSLGIALLTISTQSIRAARGKPADAIRCE